MFKRLGRLTTKRVVLLLVHLSALVGMLSLVGVSTLLPLFLLLYAVGVFFDFKNYHPVRRFILNTLGVLLSVYFLSQLSLENLLSPLSNTLLLLLSIKGLEKKDTRDFYQILLLSVFAVSLSTLHNLSISFLLVLLAELLLGLTALMFINLYRNVGDVPLSREDTEYFLKASLAFFVAVAVLSVPFFLILPRSQYPLFGMLSKKEGLKTGIAQSVKLDKVGEIQQDNTVVFRVYGLPEGIGGGLYWRVSVFDTYIGREWISTKEEEIKPVRAGKDLSYTIILEPTFERYIPLLDHPLGVSRVEGFDGRIYPVKGGVFRSSKEVNKPIRYMGVSSKENPYHDPPEDYTKLPQNLPMGLVEVAKELSKGSPSDEEKVRRVVEFFKKGFTYSSTLGPYEGDPLEYFLLVSKRGNCEYYASATALLLRLMDVPARVVGGFRGSIWNNVGKYYIITNSMAHVWVEAYVGGRWVRIDTTPPYVPRAVQRVSSIALIGDAILSFWYTNVVGFSSQRQIQILRLINKKLSVGLKKDTLLPLLRDVLLLTVGLTALYLTYRTYRALRKTPENAYTNLIHILRKHLDPSLNPERPWEVLKRLKGYPFRVYAEFVINLYLRHKYSPYKVYRDEVKRAYESLRRIEKMVRLHRQ